MFVDRKLFFYSAQAEAKQNAGGVDAAEALGSRRFISETEVGGPSAFTRDGIRIGDSTCLWRVAWMSSSIFQLTEKGRRAVPTPIYQVQSLMVQ